MKRILALVLAAILVVSCIALTSCSKSDSNSTGDTNGNENGDEASLDDPDLPEKDFGGYSFRVLTRDEHQYWAPNDVCTHESTGEPINDALFQRTAFIENKYNIKLEQIMNSDYLNEAKNSVLADDDRYDVFLMDIWRSAQLAQQDLVLEYKNIPYVDLTKKCWDQSIENDMTISGRQFFAMGDINIVDNNATWCVLFNKNLYEELEFENAYQTVNDGKWTMDLFTENCKKSSNDLNGDGDLGYEYDRWGAVGEYANVSAFLAGMGVRYVEKNSQDIPEYNLDSSKAVDCFDKVYKLMHDPTTMVRADDNQSVPDYWNVVNVNTFKGGRAVYYTCPMTHVVQMRDMEDDYGILPLPKYDENQETYYTTIQVLNATAYTIPKTNSDYERTGIILQAMASASGATLTPAYYDVTLQRRSTRDEESKEMLDIIFANRILDISNMFDWNQIRTSVENVVKQNTNTFASTVDSLKTPLISAMNETIKDFQLQ